MRSYNTTSTINVVFVVVSVTCYAATRLLFARRLEDFHGRPLLLSQKPQPVFVGRDGTDGSRRWFPTTDNTQKSTQICIKPTTSSSRSNRTALDAARPDSNLTESAVSHRDLLPRALVFAFERRTATSECPAIGCFTLSLARARVHRTCSW